MVKFNRPLSDFDAIVGIDLASQKTGITVYSLSLGEFTEFIPVTITNSGEDRELRLFLRLKKVLQKIVDKYGEILVIEERCPNQAGIHSTVQTLQALMGAHWIMRLAVSVTDKAEKYDENGIHSTSVKPLFKSENCPKPQKSDIRKALVKMYHLDDTLLTDDISDAVAVVHTLLHKKWNSDIDEQIKELKKEIKKLKAKNAIELRQQEIQKLLSYKI